MTEHNPTQLDTPDTAAEPDPQASFVDNGVEGPMPTPEADQAAEDADGGSQADAGSEPSHAAEPGDAGAPGEAGEPASAAEADPQTGSGRNLTEFGEENPTELGRKPPQTGLGDEPEAASDLAVGGAISPDAASTSVAGDSGIAAGAVPGDEDHLQPGQTEVLVGDEVVIDDETMRRALEAILMVTDEPLPVLTLARAVGRPTGDVAAALTALAEEYTEQGRGFDLREVGGGWRYYTRVEAAPYVERFVLDGQQARLTQAALETLAVVAYKQPVSRARVSAIRGVNVDGVMRTLVARGLVEEAGADTESQATLYRTTSYFLERMGMQSLEDLPELAPYLPDMDDIEEELAAQTIPSPAPEEGPGSTDEVSTPEPAEPGADAEDGAGDSDDEVAEGDTGIDGDLATGEPVELDVAHEPGDVQPSQEIEPADETDEAGPTDGEAERTAAGDDVRDE